MKPLADHAQPSDPDCETDNPMQAVIDCWFSDDPPWDPDVLERIDELAWRLDDLRTGFGTR